MLTQALIVNALVLFAVLEADLGRARRVSTFRLARPLLTAAVIVPMFLAPPTTHGTGLALEIGGGVAGVLLGLGAGSLLRVHREPTSRRIVTRAGAGYAGLWIMVAAARSCFSIGATDWFSHPLGAWMTTHQVTGAAITDTLILMAIAMTLTRTLGLAARASALRRHPTVARIAA